MKISFCSKRINIKLRMEFRDNQFTYPVTALNYNKH